MIRVYTSPGCHHCEDVKSYLRSKGLAFSEIDISRNVEAAKLVVQLGGSVPVTVIDREVVVGFNRAALDKATGK